MLYEEQYIPADKYYLKKDHYESMEKHFGMECEPVDLNAALVLEKEGTGLQQMNPETQKELQYNIRCRFDMKSKEDYEPKASY